MNKRISLFILIVLALSLFGSSPKPVHAQAWWNNSWSYRITIEINRTKIEDNFTDFPVMIYLNSSRINWTHVQDDLDDLRFIDGDEVTQLYAELENYTMNDEAWIWVKIPNVYSMGVPETNQPFYLYYGNNAVSSWWNPEDVWESSAVMVQHMRDNPDNAHVTDSTGYDNDGTKKAANEPIETASGKIDSAQSFDGINDYIDCGSNVVMGLSDWTIMVWLKTVNTGSYPQVLNTRGSAAGIGYSLIIRNAEGGKFSGYIGDGISYKEPISASSVVDDVWYRLVVVFDRDGNGQCYKDGLINGNPVDISSIIGNITNTNNLWIGKPPPFIQGSIDEIYIYNETKSAEWILADYYSGSDNLLIYGAETLCPLALIVRYNTGINKLYINGTQTANNTTIYVDKDTKVNATTTLKSDFIFMKYMLGSTGASLTPTYLFNMTQPFTLWSYATPNFFIYEEPTTFTFTHWLILLFIALVISLLAAIKFHIIATVSFILVIYMVINVASFTGIILLAIIVWLLTIMFSIMAFAEI